MKKLCLIIFGVILVVSSTAMAGIYRVDRGIVGGTGDGSSWADAYSDLQSAIEAAAVAPYGPHEVWVKAGTYKPNDPDPSNTSREQWFQLKNGVAVYGGFAGGEDLRAARDFEANETILSGDIGTEGDISDNCYHVFNHPDGSNLDATAILDGVTVTGGNANHVDDTHDHAYGGGMVNRRSSPTLRNCTISRNYVISWGGGIYNLQSSPTLTNCKVSVNTASSTGGIYQQGGSTLTMTNCVIEDCMSSAADGAGVYSNSSTVNLTNCTISGCRGRYGGAFCLLAGSATLTNCTIAGNEATGRGGAMMIDSCSPC